jgi:hypothetical protein
MVLKNPRASIIVQIFWHYFLRQHCYCVFDFRNPVGTFISSVTMTLISAGLHSHLYMKLKNYEPELNSDSSPGGPFDRTNYTSYSTYNDDSSASLSGHSCLLHINIAPAPALI